MAVAALLSRRPFCRKFLAKRARACQVSVIMGVISVARRNEEVTVRFDDSVTSERYVALQAWLYGQMSPRAPHATRCFAEDSLCLYDAFLSVLVGTGLGFAQFDDNRAHHGLYAFDFFVGDIKVPSLGKGVDGQRATGMAGEYATDATGRAMCHALVDTWLGETGRRIPFVASVIASVATLELVADVSVDECVFECDLPPGYARSIANKPWEDGSLLIGALDLSLVSPGPLIHVEASPRYKGQTPRLRHWWLRSSASPRYKGQTLSFSGFADALASAVQMGLAVESSSAFAFGAAATLRAPHGGPEMLGWAADAVARALSACGHTGGVQIRARFVRVPA